MSCFLGRIHLPHLQIRKYFTDDSSINFHDKVFFIFCHIFYKYWRKTLSWKFTDESSIKYLWIDKWGMWIRPMSYIEPEISKLQNLWSLKDWTLTFSRNTELGTSHIKAWTSNQVWKSSPYFRSLNLLATELRTIPNLNFPSKTQPRTLAQIPAKIPNFELSNWVQPKTIIKKNHKSKNNSNKILQFNLCIFNKKFIKCYKWQYNG